MAILGGNNPDNELVDVFVRFKDGRKVVQKQIPLGNVRNFCDKYFHLLVEAEVKLQRRGRPLSLWFKAASTWNFYSSAYLSEATPVGFDFPKKFRITRI